MDPAMWAVGFPKTMTIEASSSPLNEDSWPAANTVRYQFEAPHGGGPVTLTWYDGGLKPFRPAAIAEAGELPASGGLYIGDEGAIVTAHGGDTTLFPAGRRAQFGKPEADPAARREPLRGVGAGVSGRRRAVVEFRLRGAADRDGAAGERGHPGRQDDRVGQRAV